MGISADARHVFVHTAVPLVEGDRDGNTQDIYDISGGAATLLSTGPLDDQSSWGTGPDPPFMMLYQGASADGERVFLSTVFEPVVPEDTDRCSDVYERFNGQTKLVSTGPTATAEYPPSLCDIASFAGVSSDGSHVFFTTGDHLVPEDEDGIDIYERVGDAVAPLTTYPGVDENCLDRPEFGDASADGRTILFSSNMRISSADNDSTYDVYKREPDGSFAFVSRGTDDGASGLGCGNFSGDKPVAISADGRTAIFETASRLSPEDQDSSVDLYSADDRGAMSLVTTGPTDASLDEHVLVPPAWPADVSRDASHIAFESRQPLVAGDTDTSTDVYLRTPGQTELVSIGPEGGSANLRAELLSISGDGQTVAFATKERLTEEDTDRAMDFYLRRPGQVTRPGRASASRRRRPRTVLISAESIAPRMQISRWGRILPSRRAEVRLGCPKAEKSGPCHGTVKLLSGPRGKVVGKAAFRIASGRHRRIDVRLRRAFRPSGHKAALLARVSGADRLGNRSSVARRVILRAP